LLTLVHYIVPPQISIGDVQIAEGNAGVNNALFTVSLNAATVLTNVSVSFSTSDGTAVAPADYISRSGTITFSPGTNSLQIAIPVHGDIAPEADETFSVSLFNPVNATLRKSSGICTILNDDGFAGWLESFRWGLVPTFTSCYTPFVATITAIDPSGAWVSNFNGIATIRTIISETALTNGDFETVSLAPWQPVFSSNAPVLFDITGSGQLSYAYRVCPNMDHNGLKQSVSLRGGVKYVYSMDIAQSLEDKSGNGGETEFHLLVGGTEVGSFNFRIMGDIWGPTAFRTNFFGAFVAPTNGIYEFKLLIYRNAGPYPALSGVVDNIRLASVNWVMPELVQFTNGLWAGEIAFAGSVTNVVLRADDLDGHFGDSFPLTVLPLHDLDNDGIPNEWELDHGLIATDPNDANLDPDLDGCTNLQEYQADTDPQDASSVLHFSLTAESTNSPNLVLTFRAQRFRTYAIYYTQKLNPIVWIWYTNVPGEAYARDVRLLLPASGPARFYRIATPQMDRIPRQ
jgi:hypothetical protein